jgi:hypothetical protein
MMHPMNLGSSMMLEHFMFIFEVPSRNTLNVTQFIRLCLLHSEYLRAHVNEEEVGSKTSSKRGSQSADSSAMFLVLRY